MVGALTFVHGPTRPDARYPDVHVLARELENLADGGLIEIHVATMSRKARPHGQGVVVHIGEDRAIAGYVFSDAVDAVCTLELLGYALRCLDIKRRALAISAAHAAGRAAA